MPEEAPGYRPGNILDKEPTAIAAAVFAVVNFVLAVQDAWTVAADDLMMGNTALVLLLSLFVRTKSTSNSTATVLVEAAKVEAEVQVKEDVDRYLTAVAEEQAVHEADASHERYASAIVEAENEIRSLRAELDTVTAAKPAKKPAKKAVKKAP